MSSEKPTILFLCIANSCRSQMAEGLVRHYLGDKIEVASAGTMETFVHPMAIEVLKEDGIDISNQRSKNMLEFVNRNFDYIITVCDESDSICPEWIGAGEKIHVGFHDPIRARGSEDKRRSVFRAVRDEMKDKLITLLQIKILNKSEGNPISDLH